MRASKRRNLGWNISGLAGIFRISVAVGTAVLHNLLESTGADVPVERLTPEALEEAVEFLEKLPGDTAVNSAFWSGDSGLQILEILKGQNLLGL